MENNNKKKIKVLTIGIVLAVAFLAVGTYAYWTLSKRQEHDNLVFGKCLDIDLTDASEITNINLENSWPTTAENAMNEFEGYSFTITNNCETEQDYVIALEDTTSDPHEFSYSSISVAVDNTVVGPLSTTDNINPPGNSENLAKIIGYGTAPAKVDDVPGEKTHTVRIWINETSDNSEIGYAFSSRIFVVAGQYNNGESIENEGAIIAAMMKQNADTETVIDFDVQSSVSGTNGIYVTTNTDSGEPVYYYRGTVDNNLKWAGFCWKIIRTTETGGTKIIYNGTPNESGGCTNSGGTIGSSKYNSTFNDNTSVGYMWGNEGASTYEATHSNLKDSTIKTMVDNWYEYNIQNKGLAVYLEDTVYCNDRNPVNGTTNNRLEASTRVRYGVLGYGRNLTGYGSLAKSSYYTLYASPSLVCKNTTGYVPEDNDSFTVSSIIGNGKLKYPVGLITTDELIYAGFNTKGNKSNATDSNYLSSGTYWTMSPSYMDADGYAFVSFMNSDYVCQYYVYYSYGVRPVVSLRPGTRIISGFGTQEDPYVVE